MSKLLELMEAVPTGKLYSIPNSTAYSSLKPLSDFCDIKQEYTDITHAQEYRIKATFGANVVVHKASDLKYAVKQVKQSVNEAVFGEFRAPLREIQKLLWERKYTEASDKLSELETQMYEI